MKYDTLLCLCFLVRNLFLDRSKSIYIVMIYTKKTYQYCDTNSHVLVVFGIPIHMFLLFLGYQFTCSCCFCDTNSHVLVVFGIPIHMFLLFLGYQVTCSCCFWDTKSHVPVVFGIPSHMFLLFFHVFVITNSCLLCSEITYIRSSDLLNSSLTQIYIHVYNHCVYLSLCAC